jgi:hypothetical protein
MINIKKLWILKYPFYVITIIIYLFMDKYDNNNLKLYFSLLWDKHISKAIKSFIRDK